MKRKYIRIFPLSEPDTKKRIWWSYLYLDEGCVVIYQGDEKDVKDKTELFAKEHNFVIKECAKSEN